MDCFTRRTRVARVQHKCCECRTPIVPGETYHYLSGVWDGDAASFKMCEMCNRVHAHLSDRISGDEYILFGGLADEIKEFKPGPYVKRSPFEIIQFYAKANGLEVDSIEKRLARTEQAAKELADALLPFKDAGIGNTLPLTREQVLKIRDAFAAHGSWACQPELSSVGDTCNTASAG